jgi:hypothetical protein
VLPSTIGYAFYKPILAPLLKNRSLCIAITGATILHLSLVISGLPSWQSPIHSIFGIPDPGCGLSRAIITLLRGDWWTSLTFHAFASLFIIALTLITLNAILPSLPRDKLAAWVEGVERRTGLTAILLVGLVVYWLARLLIMREAFISLIEGY